MATSNAKSKALQTNEGIERILSERSIHVGDHIATPSSIRKAIAGAIQDQKPVELVLPAFPAKSGNRDKTISRLPDLGEYLALSYLQDVCERIAALHEPGAFVRICSDGHVFSDLVGITDDDVDVYGAALLQMIRDEGFSHLTTYALRDYYGVRDYKTMRELLLLDFAAPTERIREEAVKDPDRQAMFNGIHRFLFEDTLFLQPEWSRSKTRRETKDLAYDVIRRSDAWSALVAERFPGAVRLSIHPHTAASAKLGVKLVDGGGPWATPWHNAVIRSEGTMRLIRRIDAEKLGAKLTLADGKYAYFEL